MFVNFNDIFKWDATNGAALTSLSALDTREVVAARNEGGVALGPVTNFTLFIEVCGCELCGMYVRVVWLIKSISLHDNIIGVFLSTVYNGSCIPLLMHLLNISKVLVGHAAKLVGVVCSNDSLVIHGYPSGALGKHKLSMVLYFWLRTTRSLVLHGNHWNTLVLAFVELVLGKVIVCSLTISTRLVCLSLIALVEIVSSEVIRVFAFFFSILELSNQSVSRLSSLTASLV